MIKQSLENSLAYIEKYGWRKGYPDDDNDKSRCFLGAIGETQSSGFDGFIESALVIDFVKEHAPEIGPYPHIWNDANETQKEDVVQVFKNLIIKAEELGV